MRKVFTAKERLDFLESIKTYSYKELNRTQYRVENIVDIYPKGKRYCVFKKGVWGDYTDVHDLLRIVQQTTTNKMKRKVCGCSVCSLVLPCNHVYTKVILTK